MASIPVTARRAENDSPFALLFITTAVLLAFAVFFVGFLLAPILLLGSFFIGFSAVHRSHRNGNGNGAHAPAVAVTVAPAAGRAALAEETGEPDQLR